MAYHILAAVAVLQIRRILAQRPDCQGSHAVHLVLGSAVAARTDSVVADLAGSRRVDTEEAAGGIAAEAGSAAVGEVAAVLAEDALTVSSVS